MRWGEGRGGQDCPLVSGPRDVCEQVGGWAGERGTVGHAGAFCDKDRTFQLQTALPPLPEVPLRAEDGEHVTPRGLGVQPEAAAEPAGSLGFILKFMRILHAVPSVSGVLSVAHMSPRRNSAAAASKAAPCRVYLFILGLFVPGPHRITWGVCSLVGA